MENRSKLRILYLYQYLVQNTTSEQPASTVELTKMLRDEYVDLSLTPLSIVKVNQKKPLEQCERSYLSSKIQSIIRKLID